MEGNQQQINKMSVYCKTQEDLLVTCENKIVELERELIQAKVEKGYTS